MFILQIPEGSSPLWGEDLLLLYEFNSVSEGNRVLEIPRTTISTYLNTQKVYKGRYIFSFHSLKV
jgi:hypothetical protein